MRSRRRMLLCIGLVAVAGAITAAVLAATSSWGTSVHAPSTPAANWGKAIAVPGLAALNGGSSSVDLLSCTGAGNCTAKGSYEVRSHLARGFVVNEKDGVWGTATLRDDRNAGWRVAQSVLRASHLNHRGLYDGGGGDVVCAKPGYCVAGGSYRDGHTKCGFLKENDYCHQAWIATETNGVWGKAIEVPGTAQLNTSGDGSLGPISCPSTGNCTAAGTFMRDGWSEEAFVIQEKDGVWGKAIRFPAISMGSLDADGGYGIDGLFCDGPGSCVAEGHAHFGGVRVAVWVANETHGVWSEAIPVPGLEPLEHGANDARITAFSCTTTRFCTAGGQSSVVYDPYGTHSDIEPFLVTEKNGVWGNAFALPGFADLNAGHFSGLFSISCATATSCAAGGSYTDAAHRQHGFVASEQNGTWEKAIAVPGLAALSVGHNENGSDAEVDHVVCAKAGSCTAGGFYTDRAGHQQAFVTAP